MDSEALPQGGCALTIMPGHRYLRLVAVTDIDIWRVANLLIKRHGADAGTIAAQRADELLAKGDARARSCGSGFLLPSRNGITTNRRKGSR